MTNHCIEASRSHVARVLLSAISLGLAVQAQASWTITNGTVSGQFVQDPSASLILTSVTATGTGTAIPIRNAATAAPLWKLRVEDGTHQFIDVDPATPNAAGATVALTVQATADFLLASWALTSFPLTSPIASATVNVIAFAPPFIATDEPLSSIWLAIEVFLTPKVGQTVCMERAEFPRLDIGTVGPSGVAGTPDAPWLSNKLYVPIGEGLLISNFTDAQCFSASAGKDFYKPAMGHLSHSWFGTYHTVEQIAPTANLSHAFPDSQLLYLGPYDFGGWAKAVRFSNVGVPNTQDTVLAWRGQNFPPNNRTPIATTTYYLSFDLSTGTLPPDNLWVVGALPMGATWEHLNRAYRRAALYRTFRYEGETSFTLPRLTATAQAYPPHTSTKLINSSLFLGAFDPVKGQAPPCGTVGTYVPCSPTWPTYIPADVAAWRSFLIADSGVSTNSDGIVSYFKHMLYETEIGRDGMEKLVNIANPALPTPNADPSWLSVLSSVASQPATSGCLYTLGYAWDINSPAFAGRNPSFPKRPIPLPPGASNGCTSRPTCVDSLFPSSVGPFGQMRFSFHMALDSAGSPYHYRDTCDDLWVMCPASSTDYETLFWATIVTGVQTLNATTSSAPIQGVYLDNMGGAPLCYYSPDPTFQGDAAHQHASKGGGRYYGAGRRRESQAVRANARVSFPQFFTFLETPSEDMLGAVDMMSGYFDSIGSIGSLEDYSFAGGVELVGLLAARWRPGMQVNAAPLAKYAGANVSGFNTIYGDRVVRTHWGGAPVEWPVFLDPNASPSTNPPCLTTAPQSIPRSAVGTLPHPFASAAKPAILAGYNAYAHNGSSAPGVTPSNAATVLAPYAGAGVTVMTCNGPHLIDPVSSVSQAWIELLWNTASFGLLPIARDFNGKFPIKSVDGIGVLPEFPYHTNPDATVAGSMVADNVSSVLLRRVFRARSDFFDYYVDGAMLPAPVVLGNGWMTTERDFANRVCTEVRDGCFASIHRHPVNTSDFVLFVVNWMPWTLDFSIHVRRDDLGEPSTWLPLITTFDVPSSTASIPCSWPTGCSGAATGPAVSTVVPNGITFTTGPIGSCGMRAFRLQ